MLREALVTPLRGSAAAATAVVGSVLAATSVVAAGLWAGATILDPRVGLLLPVVLVPFLLLHGYGVRVVAAGLRRDNGAPTFSRPGVLLRDGIKSTMLSLVFLLPLWIVLAVGAGAAGVLRLGRIDVTGVGPALSAAVAGFTGIVALGWLACYAYLRPAAVACFADQRRLRDGLHPGRILRVALDGDYLKGWALGSLVLATGLVAVLPFVPLLVGIPLLFGVIVATNSLYGRGAARTLRGTRASATEAETKDVETIEPAPVLEPEAAAVPEAPSEAGAASEPDTAVEDLPPGGVEVPDVSEPDPAVQTGRRVPLTATDILSKSVGSSSDEKEPDGNATPETGSDATNRAAGVDERGELVEERHEPEVARRREDPDETGFAWGAKAPERSRKTAEGEGEDESDT